MTKEEENHPHHPHYYQILFPLFPLESNTNHINRTNHTNHINLTNKTNTLRQLATTELREFSIVGPFHTPFLLLECDVSSLERVKTIVKDKNLSLVEIKESEYARLSTFPLDILSPPSPPSPSDDKYYVMVSFQGIRDHIQPIHLGNYKTHFYQLYPHTQMNLQIKGPFSSLSYPEEHCMLISVDKRFKDAIFADIIGYHHRRATPITKEQFEKGGFPDVETIPNCQHKNFKIRVCCAKDLNLSKDEQVQKLTKLKSFFNRQHRKPDRIEGPMEDNGEYAFVLSDRDFWWAEWFFRDIYKMDIGFHAELISYKDKAIE